MDSDRSCFLIALIKELIRSSTNWYGADNWDYVRFGSYKGTLKSSLISKFNDAFSARVAIVPNYLGDVLDGVSEIDGLVEGLSSCYDLLADESSKALLVKLFAYRIMGPKRVRLPLSNEFYWSQRESARSLMKDSETVEVSFNNLALNHFDLNKIGYPVEAYFTPSGLADVFIYKQYEYRKRVPEIKVQNGDYVIDGGGCWGDTTLYFAHSVGASGRVYTFEFVPENLRILRRNLELNPCLMERVEIVPNPLWNSSGEKVNYSANGPGTSVNSDQTESSLQVSTMSIDDLVRDKALPRVDFIKMDIEGAELNALRGAEKTIRKFGPKLAISAYHKRDDLIEIPSYLNGLGVGYEFFLDHFTIHREETVLFATTKAD